ncbi:YHS domain-containing protein [Ghiorsea bivora]|uniref:YHS domain-containing protein n=1 Tax=Ghiorsea bivora TaxID=1485545 RepID=UPI00056FAA30|nr:YHS domain-containing protein [Ghiorsea bivora]
MKQCPVCEMQVSSNQYFSQHHGIDYWFCSTQCQQRFLARPRLYLKPIRKVMLKSRVFRVAKRLSEAEQQRVRTILLGLMGVRAVEIRSSRIKVTYNLLETCARLLVQALEREAVPLRASWLDKWKWDWVYDMEENALNNLAEPEGACCNKPPAKR